MRYSDCYGERYVVRPGDTLYSISRGFNVPLPYILRANQGIDIYNIYVGMELCIPYVYPNYNVVPIRPWPINVITPRPEPPRPEPPRPQPPRPQQPPMPPRSMPRMDQQSIADDPDDNSYVIINYVVKQDESMQDVLRRFGLKLSDVARFNRLDEIILKPGIILRVPNTNAMDEQKYEE